MVRRRLAVAVAAVAVAGVLSFGTTPAVAGTPGNLGTGSSPRVETGSTTGTGTGQPPTLPGPMPTQDPTPPGGGPAPDPTSPGCGGPRVPTLPGETTAPSGPGDPAVPTGPGDPAVPTGPGDPDNAGVPAASGSSATAETDSPETASLSPGIGAVVGGLGLPSELVLSLFGNTDVTAFGYRLNDADEVVVPAVDGVATTPMVFASKNVTVTVRAFAGDTVLGTASSDYYISDAPLLGPSETSWSAGCTGSFWLAPRSVGVVSYQVTIGDEPTREIPAGADGEAASVSWTAPAAGEYLVVARSVTAGGTISDDAYYSVTVNE